MNRSEKRTLKLGLLVAVGLVLFSMAIYYLGSQQNLFTSTMTIKSYFTNVSGLVEGNKVRYSGITVGYVSHIEIIGDTTILVEMSVDKKMSSFISTDSKAEISSDGLMGSQIVNIQPGTADAEKITDNEFIASQQPLNFQDVLREAQTAITEGQLIMGNILEISRKINNGEGDIARLLNDNSITTKLNRAGDEVLAVTENTKEIVQKVNRGEGDLGRLINDTILTSEANRLIGNLSMISNTTDSITDELLQFSTELNEGNGLISRLVYDTQMANKIDTTLVNANRGIKKATEAAESVEKSWLINLFSGNN